MQDMSTKALVSIEEYLRTSYEDYDREYLDGEVVERPLPDYRHSRTQFRLCVLFGRLGERVPLYGCTELRSRVAATRVRIPDVSIYAGKEPTEWFPAEPPLIAIEIVSPDDRHQDLLAKLEEYRRWGARHVWLVHPHTRKLYVYDGALAEVPEFHLPEFDVTLTPDEIFG